MKVSVTLEYEITHPTVINDEVVFIEPTPEIVKEAIESLKRSYSYRNGRTENISGGNYNVQCIINKPIIKKLKNK